MDDRRRFSSISEPVFADGQTLYGPRYWRRDGTDRGSEVYVFRDPAALAAYADLHAAAHLWVHEDCDHGAWIVLDIDEPQEIGEDFLIIGRRPGIYLRSLIPELTDDPAPPTERLPLLRTTIDKLVAAATEPHARFIATLAAERIRTASPRVIFVEHEQRFYIEDLEPDPLQLDAWRTLGPVPELA